jgi:metal-responsive CopG/Arc/MetJ family transcriptional regulator
MIVSFHMPEALVEELNRAVKELGYTSKSEAIRDAIRLLVRESRRRDAR